MDATFHTGDPRCSELFRTSFARLHRLAHRHLRGERSYLSLQTTELVNEAYVRIAESERMVFGNLDQFLGTASHAMRAVLVDHARRIRALKRGGDRRITPLDHVVELFEARAIDLQGLDEALVELGHLDPDLVRVVELRFFLGATEEQTAAILGVSRRTICRSWNYARQWLARRIGAEGVHN